MAVRFIQGSLAGSVLAARACVSPAGGHIPKEVMTHGSHEPDGGGPITDSVSDMIVSAATGGVIAPSVVKNLRIAFNALFSASIDVPVAYLKSLSARIKADGETRNLLIRESAERLAAGMEQQPEYSRIAFQKSAETILQRQMNVDIKVLAAVEELRNNPPSADPKTNKTPPDLNVDWLNAFRAEAEQKSSEEMHHLFGRILAGEIRNPGTFSIKTVKLLGELDQATAGEFRKLCSLALTLKAVSSADVPIEISMDARVLALGGSAATNALAPFNLPFFVLNRLHEHGLIIADYNSYMDYGLLLSTASPLPLIYNKKEWRLSKRVADKPTAFKAHGVAMSRAGLELSSIVDAEPSKEYTEQLLRFFDAAGFVFVTGPP